MSDALGSAARVAVWVVVGLGVVGGSSALGARDAGDVSRCGTLVAVGGWCCFEGQTGAPEGCSGAATACPAGFELRGGDCWATARRVRVAGGRLVASAGDWEASGRIEPHEAEVATLDVDVREATVGEWAECVRDGACPGGASVVGSASRAASGMSARDAAAFCRARGGRLPTDDEWSWWSGGRKMRRYAWGDTGAVCRRAAWGLESGPCGRGASGPGIVASHPDGASPEGLVDLAGNVGEWVTRGPSGHAVRGGSWRSALATELRSWFRRESASGAGADDVGVRCVYDVR